MIGRLKRWLREPDRAPEELDPESAQQARSSWWSLAGATLGTPVFSLLAFSYAFGSSGGGLAMVLAMIAFFGPIPMLIVLTARRRRAFPSPGPDLSAIALAFLYLVIFLFYVMSLSVLSGGLAA